MAINWDLCGICKMPLPEKAALRVPLKGAQRYCHKNCTEWAAKKVEENWDSLPDPRTFRK